MVPTLDERAIRENYRRGQEAYAAWGVDTDGALRRLWQTPLSLHCWQGDDVTGFERREQPVDGGGILATGGYPGRARTADQLRQDLGQAMRLIPGRLRVNLHAIYAETGAGKTDRNQLTPEHFGRWIDWARAGGFGLDFNPSFFAHPMANSGFTLSHRDEGVRRFWVEHGIASRRIAVAIGKALGSPCCNNVWIPDGAKDHPVDRWGPRERLRRSLDEIFAEPVPHSVVKDALEGKLFGIGSEDYVVGSHEFYLGYCVRHGKLLCLDTGHFHPTETIADKLSAILTFLDEALLHVSRGLRWDSDHVVVLNDDVRALCHELVRGGALERALFSLDFFDASINRVAAWVIGARSFQRGLLSALLEPVDLLRRLEAEGDGAAKLGLLQDFKLLPLAAVWDYGCLTQDRPAGSAWLNEIRWYERDVLSRR
jgi:L-rhamnose isomerase